MGIRSRSENTRFLVFRFRRSFPVFFRGCNRSAVSCRQGCNLATSNDRFDSPTLEPWLPLEIDLKPRAVPVQLSLLRPDVLANPAEPAQLRLGIPNRSQTQTQSIRQPTGLHSAGRTNGPTLALDSQSPTNITQHDLPESGGRLLSQEPQNGTWHRNGSLRASTARNRMNRFPSLGHPIINNSDRFGGKLDKPSCPERCQSFSYRATIEPGELHQLHSGVFRRYLPHIASLPTNSLSRLPDRHHLQTSKPNPGCRPGDLPLGQCVEQIADLNGKDGFIAGGHR